MPRSSRMPISGSNSVMMLPDEMLIECLTWLPGKQLARCKCVCKSWQSVIGSPPFLEAYRSRQPGLILHFPERVDQRTDKDGKSIRFRFFYSPLRRLKEPTEEFTCLYELGMDSFFHGRTQMVNGLMCVCESNFRDPDISLLIYNVCTGQRMRVLPEPVPYFNTTSTFHLGYDPTSRTYKLLRLIFHLSNHCSRVIGRPMRAHIMTLKPSGSLSTWRKLKPSVAGICDMGIRSTSMYSIARLHETRTFPGDGVLGWLSYCSDSLICFDLNKEKFRRVKFPANVKYGQMMVRGGAQGRLALWVLPRADRDHRPEGFIIYMLEEDEGNKWTTHCVRFPEELDEFTGFFVANGNPPSGEILLMKPGLGNQGKCSSSKPVHTYDHQTNKIDLFLVGKLPEKPLDLFGETHYYDHEPNNAKISCLIDSNNLYLPLDDVLSGGRV